MSQATHLAFFSYPKQATFGRNLPKNKIYKHSGANTRLKNLFVEQVEQIVWQYKLAPETINLPAKADVPEIQVFAIQLKTSALDLDVLRCIDGAVQFPIIFELCFEGQTKVVAAYKRPHESLPSRWVSSDYYSTKWVQNTVPRAPLPVAFDMHGLYEQLLQKLIPLPARSQESLTDLLSRAEQVAAKQREIDLICKRLTQEKQFNRKVRINAELKLLKNQLIQLIR